MAHKHLKLRPEWQEALRAGRKDIDARLVADDIADLKAGDVVHYAAINATIRQIRFYSGFRDLLASEDWRRVDPDAKNRDEVLAALESGHAETVRETGAVALELEVKSK